MSELDKGGELPNKPIMVRAEQTIPEDESDVDG